MSEAMTVPPLADASAKRTPTVYFIDDSATMREVIKIAFRKENISIIACADANSAISQFEQNPPDAVITDVIMPDQDGYSVCTQIKQHAEWSNVPVILMSGVVNKTVADKAIAVKADELIRKPFQPQELIGRVKALLGPKVPQPAAPPKAAASLSSLFAPPAPAPAPPPAHHVQVPAIPPSLNPPESVWPRALAEAFTPWTGGPQAPATPPAAPSTPPRSAAPSNDVAKLRTEVARLELLVKKLQTELQIEKQYNQALEQHLHNLTSATE